MDPFDSTAFTPASVVVYGFGHEVWPDLTGDFAFLRPEAVLDRDTVLHLVWAEPETMPATRFEWTVAVPVSLWYSRLRLGGAWSEPRRIAHYARINWSRGHSVLTVDPEDRVHIIAPVMTDSDGERMLHLVATDGEWQTAGSELPPGVYVTALLDRHPPVAAYVGGSARYGKNALFYTQLTGHPPADERRPIAVSEGPLTLFFVRLLGADDGRLHLFWARGEAAWAMTEIFHTQYSGSGWSPPARIDLVQPALSIDAVADRCGSVHLVYSIWDDRGVPVLRYRRWRNGWSGELPFPQTPVAVEPSLGLGPSGNPTLVWTTVSDSTKSHPARRTTVYSQLSIQSDQQ